MSRRRQYIISPNSQYTEIRATKYGSLSKDHALFDGVDDPGKVALYQYDPETRRIISAADLATGKITPGHPSNPPAQYPTTSHTILVAAADAPDYVRSRAHYLCDGTNDETKLQEAVNYVATNAPHHGTVLLSAGTFSVEPGFGRDGDDCVVIPDDIILQGHAEHATTIRMAAGVTSSRARMITSTSTKYCGLRDLALDGNKQNRTTDASYHADAHGLHMTGSGGVVAVANVRIANVLGAGMYLRGRVKHASIKNVHVTHCAGNGIDLDMEHAAVENCYVKECARDKRTLTSKLDFAAYALRTHDNVFLSHCVDVNSARSLYLSPHDVSAAVIMVNDCTFSSTVASDGLIECPTDTTNKGQIMLTNCRCAHSGPVGARLYSPAGVRVQGSFFSATSTALALFSERANVGECAFAGSANTSIQFIGGGHPMRAVVTGCTIAKDIVNANTNTGSKLLVTGNTMDGVIDDPTNGAVTSTANV